MTNPILFFGGIHGVGKGTICKKLAPIIQVEHITASDILKWSEIVDKDSEKRVQDIDFTQNRLVKNLQQILQQSTSSYILDGHFCLFNGHGEVEKVSTEVFVKINPRMMALAISPVEVIQNRLHKRDSEKYSLDLLHTMQNSEREHGMELADQLSIPFFEIHDGNTSDLEKYIVNERIFQ